MMSGDPAWFKGEPSKDHLSHADVQYAAEPRVPYLTKKSVSDETHGKSAERERETARDRLNLCGVNAKIFVTGKTLIISQFEADCF